MLLLYRIGNSIPVPYVNVEFLGQYFTQLENTVLGLYNVMSGGAFSSATIFALSIQPYINASIIIQLLCIAIPALERMSKDEGEEERRRSTRSPAIHTVGIALLQASATICCSATTRPTAILCSASTASGGHRHRADLHRRLRLVMWLGEQITEFGIGNGISIILFASIIARFPSNIITSITNISNGTLKWWAYLLMLVGALALIILIVIVNDAERRLPVQYSRRVVGRKQYGGPATHLPMKVNMSGVLPVIFAQSIASLPATIAAFTGKQLKWFDTTSLLYALVYFLLIIFFSYFYSTIQFNPIEVANNLKRNGGFIPGYRPGKPTSEFIQKVLNKITLFGAIYLSIIA
jgi:preprotein translocase subunit SecY